MQDNDKEIQATVEAISSLPDDSNNVTQSYLSNTKLQALAAAYEADRARLRVAVEALEHYANVKRWKEFPRSLALVVFHHCGGLGFSIAQTALDKIAGLKGGNKYEKP